MTGTGANPARPLEDLPLVVGVGAATAADAAEIGALIDAALAEAGLAPGSVRALATVAGRAGHPGVRAAARDRGWRLVAYPVDVLALVDVPNPAAGVQARTGSPGIAEAAALHAARSGGRPARLVVEKRRSARATVAVACRAGPGGPGPLPGTGCGGT